jgi:hypothetical protein
MMKQITQTERQVQVLSDPSASEEEVRQVAYFLARDELRGSRSGWTTVEALDQEEDAIAAREVEIIRQYNLRPWLPA